MRDNQNLALAVLSIIAVILLVGVLLAPTGEAGRAMAFGQLDRGGDYIMLTGQFTQNSELLYITDAAARRLNAYSYEPTVREFVIWDSVDLSRLAAGRKRRD